MSLNVRKRFVFSWFVFLDPGNVTHTYLNGNIFIENSHKHESGQTDRK